MIDPIAILMDEHRVIERVMDALMNYVEKMKWKPSLDAQGGLFRFVEFLREFVDRTHHGKEEAILFRVMVENGFPKDGGPIAVMLMDHDTGRAFVRTLKEIGEKTSEWTAKDREMMEASSGGFVSLLRQHIMKEDNILYPMAKAHLSSEAMANVVREFEEFEAKEKASGNHSRLWDLGEELWEQYSE